MRPFKFSEVSGFKVNEKILTLLYIEKVAFDPTLGALLCNFHHFCLEKHRVDPRLPD